MDKLNNDAALKYSDRVVSLNSTPDSSVSKSNIKKIIGAVPNAAMADRYMYENIEITIRLFIPSQIVSIPDPTGLLPVYGGDNRDFSMTDGTHRALIKLVTNPDPGRESPIIGDPVLNFGVTHEYDRNDTEPVPNKPDWWWQIKPGVTPISKPDTQVVTPDRFRVEFIKINSPDIWRLRFTISASLAATKWLVRNVAFDIDAQFSLDLKPLPPEEGEILGKVQYFLWGQHDGFPAYEVYLNGHPVYQYNPETRGASPTNLAPPMDQNFATNKDAFSTEKGFAPVPPKI